MTDSQKIEKERSIMTERILNLTLEIIYLLTGEDYTVVKKTSAEHITPNNHTCWSEGCNKFQSPTMDTSPPSLKLEKSNDKKILEVTQKIIELLTGQVLMRCQDVALYFSMEEWEYIEGHKELYRDAMMEDHQTLTTADESRNTLERYLRPLYSRDSTQEHRLVSQNYQGEDLILIKVETVDGKEMYVRVHEQCEEEESSTEIGTDGLNALNNIEEHLMTSPDEEMEEYDFITGYPVENPNPQNLHPVFHSENLLPNQMTHGMFFHDNLPPSTAHSDHQEGAFSCSECGDCFTHQEDLLSHQRAHTEMKLYSCFQCGKCFPWKAYLIRHLRTHTGEKPYSCSECGKCFAQKSALVRHERIHSGQKPYSCLDCGKHFSERSNLVIHERTHKSQKPFSCSQCGKCFNQRGPLISHQRSHSRAGPYSCSVCGKNFSFRSLLVRHQRCHTGEKPFSCSECGRCFAWRSALIRHERIHRTKKNCFEPKVESA
ncbi:gastrula zinc finger protein XlCGF66.1-like isoform X2 [Pyxicephalus adspersus]